MEARLVRARSTINLEDEVVTGAPAAITHRVSLWVSLSGLMSESLIYSLDQTSHRPDKEPKASGAATIST
jgi:hypothetical protein